MSIRSFSWLAVAIVLAVAAYAAYLREPVTRHVEAPASTPDQRVPPAQHDGESRIAPGTGASHANLDGSATKPRFEGGRLDGRIVDADGSPIAGVPVYLRTLDRDQQGFFMQRAESDTGGHFRIRGLESNRRYNLFTEEIAGWPGYRIEAFKLAELPSPFEIVLERYALTDLEGTVVDLETLPIANFTLSVSSLATDIHARTVTSDASGAFRLPDFPAGELQIFTAAPDYFRIQGLRADADTYRHLTLVVDRGPYVLSGRVLDPDGTPLANTRVTLNSVVAGLDYYSHAYRTRLTDTDGRFDFDALGGIPHTLGVYANGYRPLLRKIEFQSFADDLEIRLQR